MSERDTVFNMPMKVMPKWLFILKHFFCHKIKSVTTDEGGCCLKVIQCIKHGEFSVYD